MNAANPFLSPTLFHQQPRLEHAALFITIDRLATIFHKPRHDLTQQQSTH